MESLISSIWNFDGLINSALIFVTFWFIRSVYLETGRIRIFFIEPAMGVLPGEGKTFHDGKINAYFQ